MIFIYGLALILLAILIALKLTPHPLKRKIVPAYKKPVKAAVQRPTMSDFLSVLEIQEPTQPSATNVEKAVELQIRMRHLAMQNSMIGHYGCSGTMNSANAMNSGIQNAQR